MGRPKKEVAAVETVAPVEVPKKVKPVELPELKDCPNCGTASTGPYTDKHGFYRCNCSHPKCGFWDSMVFGSELEAADSWNAAGGKNKL